jgi:hypothetical protein
MSPMNNRLLVPRSTTRGLLDLVPGAAAAYSLRSLSNSYADPVVTVRRSSDDDEGSFTAAEVSDGTLAAFCGAGDGFVKQWWDQSGNARHAVAPADPNEPQIVDSGEVVTSGDRPALRFDGSDDYFNGASLSQPSAASFFCVTEIASTSIKPVFGVLDGLTNQFAPTLTTSLSGSLVLVAYRDSVSQGGASYAAATTATGSTGDLIAWNAVLTGSDMNVSVNTATATASLANGFLLTSFRIGARGIGAWTNYFDESMSEIIIYPSDLSDSTELIEANQMWYY